MGCGQWTHYEPGSSADLCGVTVVTGGDVYECGSCVIARLESQLAEARAEIESRGDALSRYTDLLIAKDARIAKLERCVVLAAKNLISITPPDGRLEGRVAWFDVSGDRQWRKWDGTYTDLLRVVEEVVDGVS